MANLLVDERDQQFVLYELLDIERLFQTPVYEGGSREICDMVLAEAYKFATEELLPIYKATDEIGCRLENGSVKVPEVLHKAYKLYCEGGWLGLSRSTEIGGQGLPHLLDVAAKECFHFNFNFYCYPTLTDGASRLIEVFGTEEQKKKYLAKMLDGTWGGTMCLTEPGAGSDVGALKTSAKRRDDGTYSIVGTKCFITAGDYDLVENIIHPVLARVEGAPAGTKGISLFLVPKIRVNADGSLGEPNDVSVGGIEHKMGIKGSATCLLNFGDNGNCIGELLGEENQGMKIMFQMMNEARIGVGLQGLGTASAAYLHALAYARERRQGASPKHFKDPTAPRALIIEHPDVRRMLLWMKAHVDGLRALHYFAAYCADRERAASENGDRIKWLGLLELLTPICKAYGSDMGFRVTEQAIQTYGGYGYCQEYPAEQFMRDVKIASIYEGTNGIQALDLVGRKLGQRGGGDFMNLLAEIKATTAGKSDHPRVGSLVAAVDRAAGELAETAGFFSQCGAQGNLYVILAHSVPFLHMMGNVVLGWLLAWEAAVADEKLEALAKEKGKDPLDPALAADGGDGAFYQGKIVTARYYAKNVLPQAEALAKAIRSGDLSVVEMPDRGFGAE